MNLTRSIDGHSFDPTLLTSGGWALDIGCRGYAFSREMANRALRVVGVEPDPSVPPPNNTGVRLVRSAVVASSRVVDGPPALLYLNEDPNACNLFEGQRQRAIQVQTTTVTDLMDAHGILQWEIVKLDCEGAEYEILDDWPGPIAKQITVEFHDYLGRNPEPNDPERYYDHLLAHLGQWYDVRRHIQDAPPWGGGLTYWDSLFVLRDS